MADSCSACRNGEDFPIPFSMAFQPIVDVSARRVYGYEALVRGPGGEGAGTVLSQLTDANRYAFDQQCRVRALELASKLGIGTDGTYLSINFLPNAVYEPRACIRLTLETARRLSFPLDKIVFEFTETEALDTDHVSKIIHEYRAIGFKVALDDFGAGQSGLGLLARIQPDLVKLDMTLARGIDSSPRKEIILKHTIALLRELDISIVCEGIETKEELETLKAHGIERMQGYYFAKPLFEGRPEIKGLAA